MKTIPKDELLALVEKDDGDCFIFFFDRGFIETHTCDWCENQTSESLADLAERLWEKATSCEVITSLHIACGIVSGINSCDNDIVRGWFFVYAKPIHRIVAAIIALQRAGVEA